MFDFQIVERKDFGEEEASLFGWALARSSSHIRNAQDKKQSAFKEKGIQDVERCIFQMEKHE